VEIKNKNYSVFMPTSAAILFLGIFGRTENFYMNEEQRSCGDLKRVDISKI
jgi:hypothetical protein